jgi:nitrate reductase NapE component
MAAANKPVRILLIILLLILGAGIFLHRAGENGRLVNTRISRTDQGAYIKYAIALRQTDFAFVGTRNRMPVYPAILACFVKAGETRDAFFERGKSINTWLTLAGLAVIGAIFLCAFPLHYGLNLLLVTMFTVFVYKAPYVQAEVLYYLLTFAVFVSCWSLFKKPRLWVAVLAGGLLGLAHLTKASVLPGLAVFLVFYPLDALWQLLRGKSRRRIRPLVRTMVVILLAGTFFAVIFPYISKSREIYGRYFYNVNSTFYIWCESWEDAKLRTKAAGDRVGWPDMPEEEIPSLTNYLRDHSAGEIAWRFCSGSSRVLNSMARSYGYLWFCLAYLAFAFWAAWKNRRVVTKLFLKRPWPVVAVAAYFVGYFLLIAWYSQIIEGNRFILGLFLPFLFAVSAFLVTFARRIPLPLPVGRPISSLTAFNVLISIWLAVEILINCLLRIPSMYGGS